MINYKKHLNKRVRFLDDQGDTRSGYIRYNTITNDYYIELSSGCKLYITSEMTIFTEFVTCVVCNHVFCIKRKYGNYKCKDCRKKIRDKKREQQNSQ